MVHLSLNSHFNIGYNGVPFSFRKSPQDSFFVKYGSCSRSVKDFRSECVIAARDIYEQVQKPIRVLCSGGVNSEVVLRSFVEAKVPVKAGILRFKNDYNIRETSYAVIACENLSVSYDFYELDILNFWQTKALEFADKTHSYSLKNLEIMWLIDQIDEHPVLGSNECFLEKRVSPDYIPGVSPYVHSEWDFVEKEADLALFRYFLLRERPGTPAFFKYSPELMYSYLVDPVVHALSRSRIVGKLSSETSRNKILSQHYNLVERPKLTGYEKILPLVADLERFLNEKYSASNLVSKTRVTALESSLTENSFPKN